MCDLACHGTLVVYEPQWFFSHCFSVIWREVTKSLMMSFIRFYNVRQLLPTLRGKRQVEDVFYNAIQLFGGYHTAMNISFDVFM